MAIINSYPNITELKTGSLLLVSDTSVEGNPTKTAPVSDIIALIPSLVPGGGTVTSVSSLTTNQLTVGSGTSTPQLSIVTADVTGTSTALATGEQIKKFVETQVTGLVASVTSGNTNTITIGGTSTAPTVAANTAAVANGSNNLATGDQIYDFVTAQGYSTVTKLDDLSDVLYSGTNLFVGLEPASLISGSANTSLGASALSNITTGNQNTAIGNMALLSTNSGFNNTAVGYLALSSGTDKSDNVGVGRFAGDNSSGSENVFIGSQAGTRTPSEGVHIGYLAGMNQGKQSVIIGSKAGQLTNGLSLTPEHNTFIGYEAGFAFGGYDNIFIGHQAAAEDANEALNTGNNNIGIGIKSLFKLTSGQVNLGIGHDTLSKITSGSYNFAIGHQAGASLPTTVESRSTFIGHNAGQNNTGNGSSVAIGFNCLLADTAGVSNVAIGKDTFPLLVNSGSVGNSGNNVAVGVDAGKNQTSGENNTYIGNKAGNGIISSSGNTIIGAVTATTPPDTGSDNTLIGTNVNTSSTTGANQIVIGSNATGHGDNIAVIGNANTTSIDPHTDNTTSLGTTSHGFTSLVLVSQNGSKFTVTVSDAGALVVSS